MKTSDSEEFHREMLLQKLFNQAVYNVCGKNCGQGDMKGISYNFCRVAAYKFRNLFLDCTSFHQATTC